MKIIVSILMSSILVLGLVGCKSVDNNQMGISNPTNLISEVIATESTPQQTEAETPYQVYSLDGMSGEEIFNLLVSFSRGINTGDTMGNYSERFSVEPCPHLLHSTSYYYYCFWGSENADYSNANRPQCSNYIDGITVNVQTEMSGTITVDESSCIVVDLSLNDYDTASSLYDLLYQYLLQAVKGYEPRLAPFDSREGTHWHSEVSYMNDGFVDYYYLHMNKDANDNYLISVYLPIV